MLRRRRRDLLERLDGVRGAVELGLHARWPDTSDAAPRSAIGAELDGCLDGVELVCTGPCPAYSFADGGVIRSTA
jgi:hypothetical protein